MRRRSLPRRQRVGFTTTVRLRTAALPPRPGTKTERTMTLSFPRRSSSRLAARVGLMVAVTTPATTARRTFP